MGQQYSHLSSEERILIEKLHCERHLSVRKIAEEIGRDKSTVSRELRRGLWFASNENRNGRIRRYLPKGTSFEDLTQDELDAIVGEINDTPMKLLGYKTPNEVWDEEMTKLQSKQADPKPAVALTS